MFVRRKLRPSGFETKQFSWFCILNNEGNMLGPERQNNRGRPKKIEADQGFRFRPQPKKAFLTVWLASGSKVVSCRERAAVMRYNNEHIIINMMPVRVTRARRVQP